MLMKTKVKSIPIRLLLTALNGLLTSVPAVHAQLAGEDNFLGNVDPEKWTCNPVVDSRSCPDSTPEDERDFIIGNGQLLENVGRAIYLTGDPPGIPEAEDALIRFWRPNVAPANQSFSVKINVNIGLDILSRYPDQGDHHYIGLGIFKTSTVDRSASGFAKVPDRIIFALRRENAGGMKNSMRLFGHMGNGPEVVPSSIEIAASRGRFDIFIDYDASTQTFTTRFQEFINPPGPMEEGGSISLGEGGHLDWGLTNEDTFSIAMITASIGEVFINAEDQRTFYDNFTAETTGDPIDIGGGGGGPSVDEILSGGDDLGDGWHQSAWLGFYNSSFAPWVFHTQHQWMFVSDGSTSDSLFLFDLSSAGWFFTGQSVYPSLFSFNRGSWVFYFEDTSGPRQFVDLQTSEAFTLD